MEDQDLAEAAAKGDEQAFAILFARYRRYLYTLAYRVALDSEAALDITQNVWIKVAERIGQFDGRGTFRSWLASIAVREAIDHRRSPSRREEATEPEDLDDLSNQRDPGHATDARTQLNQCQERDWVEGAMRSLSPQQRAILALQLMEDLGPQEIAERLGLPDKQVRSQLRRAIVRLRGMMPPQ